MAKHAGILLAAGFSRRMGTLKAALPFAGQTVLAKQINTLAAAGCDPVIVVTGHESDKIESLVQARNDELSHENQEKNTSVQICYNKDYACGMYNSIQKGAQAVPNTAAGFVILPVDCVLVSPQVVERVIRAGEKFQTQIILPVFQGKSGHPPRFPVSWKEKIAKSEGPLNVLIESAISERLVTYEETDDEAILWDMDTKEDYQRLLLEVSFVQGENSWKFMRITLPPQK